MNHQVKTQWFEEIDLLKTYDHPAPHLPSFGVMKLIGGYKRRGIEGYDNVRTNGVFAFSSYFYYPSTEDDSRERRTDKANCLPSNQPTEHSKIQKISESLRKAVHQQEKSIHPFRRRNLPLLRLVVNRKTYNLVLRRQTIFEG